MNSVKKIELVLENCEVIDVTNATGDFFIDDVHIEVSRIASNCIAKILKTKEFYIQLYKFGEFKFSSFGDTDPITRLKDYKDITSIELTYDDDLVESYYVDYDEGENEGALGADNINQKTYETENSLFILVSANKTFDDFNIEEVDADWYLENDVNARLNLRENGWKELINRGDFYEFYLASKQLFISLSQDSVKMLKVGCELIEFAQPIFSEILTYLFYKFEIKSSLNQDDFKYIELDKIIENSENDGVYNRFEIDNHIIEIRIIKTKENTSGIILIDNNYEILLEDMLSFMWILLKITDTN